MPPSEGRIGDSLGAKLFKSRLELIGELDEKMAPSGVHAVAESSKLEEAVGLLDKDVPGLTAAKLHEHVGAMNLEKFVVRPQRRLVEKCARAEAWAVLPAEARSELATHVANLPTELDPENEEAKRFDLLLPKLQLATLRGDHAFEGLRDQVQGIAGLLEEKASIPAVQAQMPLILDLQTDEWWQDVTVAMLEGVRRRLRELVQLIDRVSRTPLYSDFEGRDGTGDCVRSARF